MSWQRYDLRFRLESPLHIGARKTGNLNETRGYVHGKVLWAALTARLTRDHDDGASGPRYVAIGKDVQKHFRFTYLYPALAKDREDQNEQGKTPTGLDDVTTHYPWQDDFAYRFLGSYASTALDYDHQAAEEGSLHEMEFIRPFARPLGDETPPPVYLAGSIYVKAKTASHSVLSHWPQVFQRLQIGGERTYGWGRLRLVSDVGQPNETLNTVPQSQPVERWVERRLERRLTAHACAATVSGVRGVVEPLVGWERENNGNGRTWRVSTAQICYAPGAQVDDGAGPFTISDQYGILKGRQTGD